ncbi:hypothetical protein [Actinoplanes sp. NPDC049802]|uniref:hypothetical protein n=1 Tax=Actinoplanes sp. NPDC049802 TaxID=3154742 RepID=UPI0033EEC014
MSTPAVNVVPVAAIWVIALAVLPQAVDPVPTYWNCTVGVTPAGKVAAADAATVPMIVLPPPLGPATLLRVIGTDAADAGVAAASNSRADAATETGPARRIDTVDVFIGALLRINGRR